MTRTTHETYLRGGAVRRESTTAADGSAGFGGVAVSDGDVLYTTEDPPRPFLVVGDELAKANFSPAASVLTKDHPEYSGGSPPVDATVGALDTFGYSADANALVYNATPHDRDIEEGVRAGNYDVSISADFALDDEDTDPETGLPIARDYTFHDLSVVSIGQAGSNTAQWGGGHGYRGRRETASIVHDGDRFASALASATSRSDGDTGPTDDMDVPTDPESWAERMWHRFATLAGGGDGDGDDSDDGDTDSGETTSADTDTGGADTDTETTMKRATLIERLAQHDDYDEDTLADYDDGTLRGLGMGLGVEDIDEFESSEEGGDSDTEDGEVTETTETPEMPDGVDVDENGKVEASAVRDLVRSEVTNARETQTKADLVDEMVDTDEYDDDDRDDLMASSVAFVRRHHSRVTKPSAASLPGVGGKRSAAKASISSDDEYDLDAYGTGVSE